MVHLSSICFQFGKYISSFALKVCVLLIFLSMTQSLEMHSGTAPSTALSVTCWGWWPAGPSSVMSGTCRRCTKRCVSLAEGHECVFLLFSHRGWLTLFLFKNGRMGKMLSSLPTEWSQPSLIREGWKIYSGKSNHLHLPFNDTFALKYLSYFTWKLAETF